MHTIYMFLLLLYYMMHSFQAASLSPSQKAAIPLLSSASGSDNTTATQGGVEEAPSSASDTDKHEHQDRNLDLLKAELTVENYKDKFHQLLCREEEQHEKALEVK